MPRTGKGGGPSPEMASTGTASAGGRTFGEPSLDAPPADLGNQPQPQAGGAPPEAPPAPGPEGGMPPGLGGMGGSGPLPGELPGLGGDSLFGDEPITAGIDSGPGPGSSALASNSRRSGGRNLIRIAEETGDPFLLQLAERIKGRQP